MVRGVLLIYVSLLLTVAVASGTEIRTWRDKTGHYDVSASLLELRGGTVLLKRTDDGSHIPVSVFRLSYDDTDWLYQNIQPQPLLMPPIPIDLTTVQRRETQHVDLSDVLVGIEDFSITNLAINGMGSVEMNGKELAEPGDGLSVNMTGLPGASINLRRGRGGESHSLLLQPQLEVDRVMNIALSTEAIGDWLRNAAKRMRETESDLRATEAQLHNLPAEIRTAERRFQMERGEAQRARWAMIRGNLVQQLTAAQRRAPALMKRLEDDQRRHKQCKEALQWLQRFTDTAALTFRIESEVSDQWLLPVAATWPVEDAQSLGELGRITVEWRKLAHQGGTRRASEEARESLVKEQGRRIANRPVTVRFVVIDIAVDEGSKPTIFVSPLHRLAGIEYPATIAPALLAGGVQPVVGRAVDVTGTATLHLRDPQAAEPREPPRRLGELIAADPPPQIEPEPAEVVFRFDLPSTSGTPLQMWLKITPATQ